MRNLFDENRQPLKNNSTMGKIKTFYIIVEIWTVNSRSEILVTLRHPDKIDYPCKWENTGGFLLSDETSRQGATRELYEETGIIAKEEELIFLGTHEEQNAFADIYLLKRDVKIEKIILQEGETIDAKWVSIETLEYMMEEQTIAFPNCIRLKYVRDEFNKYCRK